MGRLGIVGRLGVTPYFFWRQAPKASSLTQIHPLPPKGGPDEDLPLSRVGGWAVTPPRVLTKANLCLQPTSSVWRTTWWTTLISERRGQRTLAAGHCRPHSIPPTSIVSPVARHSLACPLCQCFAERVVCLKLISKIPLGGIGQGQLSGDKFSKVGRHPRG